MKKVSKKYREMTQREKEKLPLIERYRLFLNEYRGARIEIIVDSGGETRVRYFNGDEVRLPDVLAWTQLFNELTKLHPAQLSPTRPDESHGDKW